MSMQCKIIEDLLPLYHDSVCSAESRQMVEEHLSQCEACRHLLDQIDGEIISPAKDTDMKILKGISKEVRKGRKKAFITGISITLAVVLLLFIGASAWWYCHEYAYYSAFAEEGKAAASTYETEKKESLQQENNYVWCDDTYQYHVVVPNFLSDNGFVGMSRLDNDKTQMVELAVTRWKNEPYIFHVFVNNTDEIRYFIIDRELNLHGNYSEEEMHTNYEKLNECKETVQEIINDAIVMWPFMDETVS